MACAHAVDQHLAEQAETAALGFVDAQKQAHSYIDRHLATGFARRAQERQCPGWRA